MSKSKILLIQQLCAISLEASLKDKVRITPVGEVNGIDGRYFNIDAQDLLKSLKKNDLDLPLTKNHEWRSEAQGWFSAFELRDNGIYATLELNEAGKDLLERKAYKYLSPEYLVNYENNKVLEIVGVGLVSKPNLLNEALNNTDTNLSTNEDTSMNETDAATLKSLTEKNAMLEKTNADLIKQVTDMKISINSQVIDNAIATGDLLPAKKDFALSLNVSQLDDFLASEKIATKLTIKNHIKPDAKPTAINNDSNNSINEQLGLNDNNEGEK